MTTRVLRWLRSTVQPSSSSSRPMTSTSRMSGTLVIVVVPGASSEAAISLSTLFFAPPPARCELAREALRRRPPGTVPCAASEAVRLAMPRGTRRRGSQDRTDVIVPAGRGTDPGERVP